MCILQLNSFYVSTYIEFKVRHMTFFIIFNLKFNLKLNFRVLKNKRERKIILSQVISIYTFYNKDAIIMEMFPAKIYLTYTRFI